MPACRFCSCNGEDDGIASGKERPLPHSGQISLTSFFESELQHNRIELTKPAVVFTSAELTFAQVDHYSNGVALEIEKHMGNAFTVANPDEEILIGVCLPISERIIPLMLAVLKLGAAFLPLDPKYPEDLLLSIINKFRPIMVITDDNGPILGKYDAKQFADYSKLMSVEEIWLDMELPSDTNEGREKANELRKKMELFEPPVPALPHERPAIVIHTTGVSNPKGIRISHSVLLNRICWEWREMPYSHNETCALTSPITSVQAFVQIFGALIKGVTIHLFKRNEIQNMSNFIHKIADRSITRLYFTPTLLDSFIKACETLGKGSTELQHIKFVFCVGDLIPNDLARNFLNFFVKSTTLINTYGGTEGDFLYNKFKDEKDLDKKLLLDKVLLDKVVDNLVVYIMSNYLEIVTKEDTQGEICIAGSLAMGYVDKKEETDKKFVENRHDERENYRTLFRTGDYGRYVRNRNGKRCIYIEGRLDTQVKIHGYDVIMDEIQDLIMMNDKVEETYLMIYHPGRVDQSLLGFVLQKNSVRQSLMADEVKGRLLSKIPEYLAPEIKIIEQVPMVGKQVCPQYLMRLYQDDKKSNFNNWGKVRLTNEKLAACKLLVEGMYKFAGIPIDFAVNSLQLSFQNLGGTSLNAVSVVLYINRNSCPLNLKEFLRAQSLNDLINVMSQRLGQNRDKLEDQGTLDPILIDSESEEEYEITVISTTANIRKEAISILSRAYADKGDLVRYDYVTYEEFYNYFIDVWDTFVEQHHSTIVTRKKDNKMVGCCLCQDFYTPSIEMIRVKSIYHLLDYTQELKGSVLNNVPHVKNSIFEVSWLSTSSILSPMENVIVVLMMMNENHKLAKLDNYTSVFCTATSPLMRELCLDIFNYKLLQDYTARNFQQTEDFHPFRCAPLTVTSALCLNPLGPTPSYISSSGQSTASALIEEPQKKVPKVVDTKAKDNVKK